MPNARMPYRKHTAIQFITMNNDPEQDAKKRWFEEYTTRIDQGVLLPPQPDTRYNCPCCGYPTLSERGGYDVCELCIWEDDGQDDPHADEIWGGPNGNYSLTEARANFRLHLSHYSPEEEAARASDFKPNPARNEAKRRLIHAFNSFPQPWTLEQEAQIINLEQTLAKVHDQLPLP